MSTSTKCRAKNPSACRVHGTPKTPVSEYYRTEPAVYGGNRKSDPLRLAQSQVIARKGWTLAAVQKFLGEPDALRKNPKYASAPRMKVYDLARVEGVESTLEFADFVRGNRSRVAGAQQAAEKRAAQRAEVEAAAREKLESYMDSLEVQVRPLPGSLSELRVLALRSYNEADSDRRADLTDSASFLNRITVNYLRHEKTNYDEMLLGLLDFPRRDTRDEVYQLKSAVHRVLERLLPADVADELSSEFKSQNDRAFSDSLAASFDAWG